jgi:murein DD-endopeptidase MepM/ murein hydrolase activator NlpD
MTRKRSNSWSTLIGAAAGFVGGASLMAVLLGSPAGRSGDDNRPSAEDCGPGVLDTSESAVPHDGLAKPASGPEPRPADAIPRIGANPTESLRDRNLLVPVEGFDKSKLYGSFTEKRGSNRLHEAIDLLAPRNTPVIAVEDGTVARLFSSKAGGITVYQFDPSTQFVYYYAHLERYAPGLTEGAAIRRGQVIGYVGTSGNAPPDTPHLHFAIFKMTDRKQWWDGVAIDPYEVLR